jgi:rhodanese-related sulfurtransferase
MKALSPPEVKALLDSAPDTVVLDVREPWEIAAAQLEGTVNIPMSLIPVRLTELDPARTTVVICHHGGRSAQVAMFLEHRGFGDVINLSGGIDAWSAQVDPSVPRY